MFACGIVGGGQVWPMIWIMPFRHPSNGPLPQQHQHFRKANYNGLSPPTEAGEEPALG